MAHKGSEKSNAPRIALEVTKELKKAFEHYCIENEVGTKETVTKLIEKLLSGKIKL